MSEVEVKPRLEWAMVVRLAWPSAIAAIRKMMPLFLSAAVLYAIFGIAERWILDRVLPVTDGLGDVARGFAAETIALPEIAANALLLAPVAVAVHRFVLLDEVSPGFTVLRQPCLRNFVIWTFCVQLALNSVAIFGIVADISIFPLLAWIALFALFGRTLLIFPAVAIEVPAASASGRIEASLTSSRGLFWTTIFAVIVSVLPLILVEYVPDIVAALMGRLHDMHPNLIAAPEFDVSLVSAVLDDLAYPLGVAVLAAVASWIYLWTQGNLQAAPTLTQPPPET